MHILCISELPQVSPLTLSSNNVVFRGVGVLINSVAELDCTVFGIPAPELHWEKDSTQLSSGTQYSITTVPSAVHYSRQTLTVSGVALEDAARYTCVATNRAGMDEASIDLEVIGMCECVCMCVYMCVCVSVHDLSAYPHYY